MRILVINGGGAAGYAAASFLASMQEEMGEGIKWSDLFDMIVGVSTGSLIAAAIAYHNKSGKEIADLYLERLPSIFKYRWKWKTLSELVALVYGTVYGKNGLSKNIDDVFGASMIGDKTYVPWCMLHATQLSPTVRPFHWKSWDIDRRAWRVRDAVIASCSAPYFFPTHTRGDQTFADGGLVDNNPTMHSIIEAKYVLRANEPLQVMNLCCVGHRWGIARAKKLSSFLSWRGDLIGAMMTASENSVTYQARSMLGSNYLEIDLDSPCAMDPVTKSSFDRMAAAAYAVWASSRPAVARFFEGVKRGPVKGDSEGYHPHPLTPQD